MFSSSSGSESLADLMNSMSRSRYLANSPASKRGRMRASLSSSIISARSRARNWPLTEMASAPADALKLPPTPSTASANSYAERLPAPRSSSPATSEATPSLPAGSASAPPRTKPLKAIIGTSFFGMRMMVSPFDSAKRWWAGTYTPEGSVAAGSPGAANNAVTSVAAIINARLMASPPWRAQPLAATSPPSATSGCPPCGGDSGTASRPPCSRLRL
jgi:hypothetical protein